MFLRGAICSLDRSAIYANRHYLADFRKESPDLLAATAVDGISGPTIIGDVRILEGAVVDASAKVGPNVTIGSGARVGAGSRVKDSILLDGVIIGVSCDRCGWLLSCS